MPSPSPLDGACVLDLTHVLAGPFASMRLGDRGADVIKVEPPWRGDTTRHNPPFVAGGSLYFLSGNRGKRSIAVDLEQREGRAIVLDLARRSDSF